MDLRTNYLGLELAHPFIPGASPLADEVAGARRLEDAGAPLITMRSLFEEQIIGEQAAMHRAVEQPAGSFAEALSYLPEPQHFAFGPHEYLEHVRRLREAVSVPIVASLNGATDGGWLAYARMIEEAGASALELNIYDPAVEAERPAEEIERRTLEMVRHVRRELRIPLAVKLSPFYTAFAHFARRLDEAGADAIVIFNRFYQPDIDLEELEVWPTLHLSHASELPLRLRWLAILTGRLRADLAVTGGVHTAIDAVKAIMCGATAVQMVSALLKHGPGHLGTIRERVAQWMAEHAYESLEQMRGCMGLERCPEPRSFERANYMQVLQTWRP